MNELDDTVRRLCAASDYGQATTVTLKELGPSVLRYIDARIRDDDLTAEAFQHFAEDLWRGLPNFGGRSPLRVWAFVVARNAAGQVLRRRNRERKRTRAFTSTLDARLSAQVRTTTRDYMKTDVKQRFMELREELSPEERTLLVLRINERLPWEEIAVVQSESEISPAELKREAARLRKRFQLIRDRLKRMATDRGLL
jgi:RNA polymerase sigma-70 factor (ECF subfamily)